jgi:hypothetical protein
MHCSVSDMAKTNSSTLSIMQTGPGLGIRFLPSTAQPSPRMTQSHPNQHPIATSITASVTRRHYWLRAGDNVNCSGCAGTGDGDRPSFWPQPWAYLMWTDGGGGCPTSSPRLPTFYTSLSRTHTAPPPSTQQAVQGWERVIWHRM